MRPLVPGVIAWRSATPELSRFGPVAGVTATGLTYLVGTLVVGVVLVILSIIQDPSQLRTLFDGGRTRRWDGLLYSHRWSRGRPVHLLADAAARRARWVHLRTHADAVLKLAVCFAPGVVDISSGVANPRVIRVESLLYL